MWGFFKVRRKKSKEALCPFMMLKTADEGHLRCLKDKLGSSR